MSIKTLLIGLSLIASMTAHSQYKYPFLDPRLNNADRAKDLISRLTIDEKANLMMHYSPAVERLGIRQFQWWGEALHGVGFAGKATVFPEPIGMAASFDDKLLQKIYDAISDEARAKFNKAGKNGSYDTFQSISMWTPNINIFRDPRWGRGQETYGEDPYLTSRMGLAVVNGLQGGEGQHKYYKTFACAKHFAVHSGPEWSRHSIDIDNISARDLFETYLPAFKDLVQKGNVREVMCAYNSVDGEPCCSNTRLLQQILRDEWGFNGIVVSDCDAISDIWEPNHHNVEPDKEHASARAAIAGTDLNCGGNYTHLPEAVKAGLIKEEVIDSRLQKLIEGRIMLGEFDPDAIQSWNTLGMDIVDSKAHQQLALQMAQETMTLLHNPKGILPLDATKKEKIVLMGPNANDSIMEWGNYSGRPKHTVTLADALQKRLGQQLHFIDGCGYTSKNIQIERRFNWIENGLVAEIWNNIDMKGSPLTTKHFNSPINFNLNETEFFASGVPRTNFSVRLKGVFTPQKSEDVLFKIAGDDGFRLIIGNDTIVNEWRSQATLWREHATHVEAGKHYPIQIDYYQEGSNAELQFDVTHTQEYTDDELLAKVGDATTVIFAGGISSRLEGEEMDVNEVGFKGGDRTDIQLPNKQRNMLAKLHEMGKKVILVNYSGSSMGLLPETKTTDAILQAWYPGEQGGTAVAETLFGDINPSGKLPITFYCDTTQLPDFQDYRMTGRTYRYLNTKPLFPFGYGLSYTTFKVGKPKVFGKNIVVNVTNTGKFRGTETIQLYIRSCADQNGPKKSLRGFSKVTLKPGETQKVSIPLTSEMMTTFDESTNTMRVLPGDYQLFVGTSSDNHDLQTIKYTLKTKTYENLKD